jgi:predicted nucleic acid-binding protein
MRKVVVNSTPIIALAEIGLLRVLKDVYGEVVIPNAVRDEVTAKDPRLLDGSDWIRVATISNIATEMFSSALHKGEVEVMLLAKEIATDLVIMDDKLARRYAKHLGLTVTGTAGVLLRAKSIGVINEVAPVLDKLIQNGLYISTEVYRDVLRLAGE